MILKKHTTYRVKFVLIYHSKTNLNFRSSTSLFMERERAMKFHLEWSNLQKQESPKQAAREAKKVKTIL